MKVFIRTRQLFDLNIVFEEAYNNQKSVTVGSTLDLSWEKSCNRVVNYMNIRNEDPVRFIQQKTRQVSQENFPFEIKLQESVFLDIRTLPHIEQLSDKLFLKDQIKKANYESKIPVTKALIAQECYHFSLFVYPTIINNIINLKKILKQIMDYDLKIITLQGETNELLMEGIKMYCEIDIKQEVDNDQTILPYIPAFMFFGLK